MRITIQNQQTTFFKMIDGDMMSENLLTVISIAKELGLPESTIRFYRDKFLAYIPFEGEGRKRRYHPEAVKVLRFIANSLRKGKTAKKTSEALASNFTRYNEAKELNTSIMMRDPQPNQLIFYEQRLVLYERKMQILAELVKSLSREVITLRKEYGDNNNSNQKNKELINRIERLEMEKFSLFAEKKKLSNFQKELNKLKRPLWKKLLGIG